MTGKAPPEHCNTATAANGNGKRPAVAAPKETASVPKISLKLNYEHAACAATSPVTATSATSKSSPSAESNNASSCGDVAIAANCDASKHLSNSEKAAENVSESSPKRDCNEKTVNTQLKNDSPIESLQTAENTVEPYVCTAPVDFDGKSTLPPATIYDALFVKSFLGFVTGKAVPAEITRQRELLLMRKKEKVFLASLLRDYRLGHCEAVYAQEKSSALRDYESQKNTLKDRMIAELQEKKKRIAEEKDFLESAEAFGAINGSYLLGDAAGIASKNNAGNLASGSSSNGRKSRRRAELELKAKRKSAADAVIRGQISDVEILEDLFLIFGDSYNAVPHKRKAKSGAGNAFVERSAGDSSHPFVAYYREQDNCLIYDSISYRKGDDVLIEKEDQDEYSGEIISVSTNELWIKTAEGIRSKINISQLRQGKTFLSHLGSQ